MYATSFRLPKEVAFGTKVEEVKPEKVESRDQIYEEFEDKNRKKIQKTE